MTNYIAKGWGGEVIWANEPEYCGKILKFKAGAKFSMHFHKEKKESWYVLSGVINLHLLNMDNASITTCLLEPGSIWTNMPGEAHQIEAITDSEVLEVSTKDSVKDNYRVFPGDSQKCE